jgi:hypothetical protein
MIQRLKHLIFGEHTKALFSGAVCVTVFVTVFSVLISTAHIVWAQAVEYPTHREIMDYMSSENSRVAVIQSNQDRVLTTLVNHQAVIVASSERIAVLESNQAALMKIAWATMFAVFAMLSKGIFETYQRASLNSVRENRKHKSTIDIVNGEG